MTTPESCYVDIFAGRSFNSETAERERELFIANGFKERKF